MRLLQQCLSFPGSGLRILRRLDQCGGLDAQSPRVIRERSGGQENQQNGSEAST
ncbi:MAG: hypothetical protein OXQ89_16810 [Rhodospirillaceae bacterium]|nr:hypothetical protein [Rhodospirillaceae bacterium]